jgi:hypothetical protein
MGGACDMHGRDKKCIHINLLEILKGRDHVKKLIPILAQDRDWWQGLVNTVMNLQVP